MMSLLRRNPLPSAAYIKVGVSNILVFLLIAGGFFRGHLYFEWFVSFILTFLVFVFALKLGKIDIPIHMHFFGIFMGIFLIGMFWSKNLYVSLRYFLYFYSGGLLWLIIHNLRKFLNIPVDIKKTLISVGLVFGVLFLVGFWRGTVGVGSYSLVNYSVLARNHHHIGDFWAVVLAVLFSEIVTGIGEKSRWGLFWKLLLAVLGIIFLVLSFSRSAYLSLIITLFYLIYTSGKVVVTKYKPILFFVLALLTFLFIYSTAGKSLILHRAFYLQAIAGIVSNPLGIGVGNFSFISMDPSYQFLGISGITAVSDNLILEMLLGMGVFGILFAYWFFRIINDLFFTVNKYESVARIAFLVLSINFMFNYAYFIPTFLWIWFICLGQFDFKGKTYDI